MGPLPCRPSHPASTNLSVSSVSHSHCSVPWIQYFWREAFRRSESSGGVVGRARQAGRGEAGAPAAARQQLRSGSADTEGTGPATVQAALDPPSPRVAACGICGIFGNDKQLPPAHGAGRLTQQRSRTSPPKHQLQGTAR
ncbi:uncharacterized protein C2845_PM01G09430 [Panicum miliaceum]|uniref:Uncharacterized protein n=1 Tax=Panicum miliaceum TaxID=4540 RepID=A0A3L6TT85_PANMI|nr:uncharacterized protein C2845_PM01G09430 [Panicum miliaceum]